MEYNPSSQILSATFSNMVCTLFGLLSVCLSVLSIVREEHQTVGEERLRGLFIFTFLYVNILTPHETTLVSFITLVNTNTAVNTNN